MIVVFDASTLISAAPKVDSIPERALLRAVTAPNRLLLSQEIENEYREVISDQNSTGSSRSTVAAAFSTS